MSATENASTRVDPGEIDAALISGLYRRTKPLLIANLGASGLLCAALWSSTDRLHLILWTVSLMSWTMVRFALARLYLRKPRAIADAWRWTLAFAVGSGIAGLLWGWSILLVTSLEADASRLAVPFVMAALSAAAIAGYTNSMIAFSAFLLPALVPYGLKLVWLDGSPDPMIATFVLFWVWLMWSMAKHLNEGFKDGIWLTLQNRNLMRRMSRARDVAEAASLAKTRFLANMSHELRTPLNAILGYTEMMTGKVLGPIGNTRYEPYVQHVYDSGVHLLHIVDQVLDLSKLEAGKVDLSEDTIDLSNLIDSAIDFIAASAAEDKIEVAPQIAPDLPHLRGDATKVRQILLNLLSNAVKYTLPGGRITVSAECPKGTKIELCVRDTGIGIPAERMAHILTPFAHMENQEHAARTKALKQDVGQTSTGLGLPLVKRLADLHDAEVEIDSTLDVGTAVRIQFPYSRTIARPRNDASQRSA